MAECPWCHGPVKDPRAPCPQCGKLATDLRTTDPPEPPGPGFRAERPAGPAAADVPDLFIPAPAPSRPSAVAKAAPTKPATPPAPMADLDDELLRGGAADLQLDLSAAGPAQTGIARPPTPGGGFSPFDDDFGAGPALELDTTGGALPPRVSSPEVPAPPSQPLPPAPISQRSLASPAPPTAPTDAPSKPTVDPFEAKAYADYGPPPAAFWMAPIYAYRVATRRAALQRDLAGKKADVEQTMQRVEEALVSLGERARALAKGGDAALARVRDAEELLRGRDGALAGAMDTHRAALGEIDGRLATAEAELGRLRDAETAATGVRDAADEEHKRADAKLKRLDIEIRNGAVGRDTERSSLGADAAQKLQRRTEADRALAEARRVTLAAQGKADGLAAERRAQEAKFSRQSGARNAGVDDAQKHLRVALAELGRAMLSDPSVAAELAAARDQVARLEEQSKKRAAELALHETALTAYDAPKVFLGFALLGLALVLLCVLVFFPVIYHAVAG